MKKLLVLLGVAVLSSGVSFASIDETKTSDIDILRNQGYSESMLNVVDVAKSFNSYNKGKSRYYRNAMDRGNFFGKKYSYLKTYFDPVQDDGLFGEHQINFSNSWDWGRNRYSSRYTSVSGYENL